MSEALAAAVAAKRKKPASALTRKIDACPCCGQEWMPGRSKDDARRVLKEVAWQGPVQTRVIECLLRNFGSYVPRRDLIDAAFSDDPDGGPDDANSFMAVTVNRIRRRLRLFGFEIDGKAWYGSRLRWRISDTHRSPEPGPV